MEANFFIYLQVTTLFLELTLQKTAKKEEKKKLDEEKYLDNSIR